MTAPALLRVDGLVKHFGGLMATDHVTLDVQPGEIHALIGPNGAGKTTLINQICGELEPDEGEIFVEDQAIGKLAMAKRVGFGLARTFQITRLLNDYTVSQNLATAIQARRGRTYRLFDNFSTIADIAAETAEILQASALASRAGVIAADLSHGERKQLELLMALSLRPRLLLLDEPMAGLGHAESQQMIDYLKSIRGSIGILLVEHDMEAVFSLADRISVLVYGRVIFTGSAEEVRNHPEVREAYLGEGDAIC